MKTGRFVIFSGPSGVGKDTLLEAWQARNPLVHRIVTYTTRSPRASEQDGIDYHFVNAASFDQMIENGEFLEYKLVHGNRYGTPLKSVEAMVEAGEVAILKIDVQGAMTALEKIPSALTVFILPPSHEELENRIRSRATDDEAAIACRLQNAVDEIAVAPKYRFQVVNESIEQAVNELERILAESGFTEAKKV